MLEIIGLKLLELREDRNISQVKLCDDLNINRTSYNYYEKGKRIPDVGTLLRIAEYYGISLDELVKGSRSAQSIPDDMPILDSGIALARHLHLKHIAVESILEMSKKDIEFLTEYKRLSADNQAEIKYIMDYKIRKQTPDAR